MSCTEFSCTEEDAQRIIEIQEAVGWGKYLAGPAAFLETYKQRQEGEGFLTYVAMADGIVVGYIDTVQQPSVAFGTEVGQAYVLSAAVDPKYKTRGVADSLGAHVKKQMVTAGFKVALTDVAADNTAALELNRKHGGKLIGTAPDVVQHMGRGATMVRMRHDL